MRSMSLFALLLLGGAACRDEATARCELPHEGVWELQSEELGSRPYRAELEVDAGQCGFYLKNFDPELPTVIDGGQIDVKRVNLSGDAFWSTCSGSLTMQGSMMSGQCDNEITFHFMHDAPGDGEGGHGSH